jgi:hypothetical protein
VSPSELLSDTYRALMDVRVRSIRILFSISDLDAEQEHDAEEFVDEESADAGSGGVGDEESDTPGGPSEGSFPVETTITVTKPGQGALTIDACAQGEHDSYAPMRWELMEGV